MVRHSLLWYGLLQYGMVTYQLAQTLGCLVVEDTEWHRPPVLGVAAHRSLLSDITWVKVDMMGNLILLLKSQYFKKNQALT